jgi:phosphomannomutase/phosphoglucomutase
LDKKNFPFHIFRKYDIRGVYGDELTPQLAYRIAAAFAAMCREWSGKEAPVVAVGMDARVHSPPLRDAFAAGLAGAGCGWVDIGLCPTPLTYFSAFVLDVDAFAMITASHNPPGDNGLKLGIDRETIHSGDIEELGRRASLTGETVTIEKPMPARKVDIVQMYKEFMVDKFSGIAEDLRAIADPPSVVVDSGNGTAGVVFPDILKKLGATVHELFSEPDGTFPNHHPDPTLPEALESLRAEMKRTDSNLGISFDGDADRIGVMDENGRVIWGDMLLLILGRDIVERWKEEGSPGDPPLIISEVLYDGIREAGGRALMWKTGHSLIKAKMKETGAAAAGEMSGHLFFADRYFGYDDALYGALRLLEVYIRALREGTCGSFSDLLKGTPDLYSTPEIRFECDESIKFDLVEKFTSHLNDHLAASAEPRIREIIDIDGVRVRFEEGWGLLRASNTQPVLVMRFEGPDEKTVKGYQDLFHRLLGEAEEAVNSD